MKGGCKWLENRTTADCVQPPIMKYFMRGLNKVSQICMLRKPCFMYSAMLVRLQILKFSLSEKIFTFLTSGFKARSGL